MNSITISLPDERLEALQAIAARIGVTTEELIRYSIQDILSHPDEILESTVRRVLEKNTELYRRLA